MKKRIAKSRRSKVTAERRWKERCGRLRSANLMLQRQLAELGEAKEKLENDNGRLQAECTWRLQERIGLRSRINQFAGLAGQLAVLAKNAPEIAIKAAERLRFGNSAAYGSGSSPEPVE